MKIIFLTGMSGCGKTTVAQELCKNDKYNYINSYTDREMREADEFGHEFISTNFMDALLQSDEVVASTEIDGYRYCSLKRQFDENKINVYVVDVDGINDTLKFFPYAEVMSILIRREKIMVDCIRADRDVCIPPREDVDFCIDNNYKIESVANTINALVGFDFFTKPSHVVRTLQDKIKHIEMQYRLLDSIKHSLLTQLWYQCQPQYIELCKYVSKKINEEFDFDVVINPDDKPAIYDGYLHFHVIGEYTHDDVKWTVMDNLVGRISYHAHNFCKERGYNELALRLTIAEDYVGDDGYV